MARRCWRRIGVGTYIGAVEAGALPIARWLHLGSVGGLGYDAFWQAYAGRISPATLADAYGRPGAAALEAALVPLAAAGLVAHGPGGWWLTPRGFDAYHDLERAVTYRLIEPLWAQMLAEHGQESGGATWATPVRARTSRVWEAVTRLLERPVDGYSAAR